MKSFITLLISLAELACQPAREGGSDTTAAADSPAGMGGARSATTTDTTSVGAMTDDTTGVTLTLDRTTYAPGATAVMRIASQRADMLGYNPCSNRSVERETASGWAAHPEPNRICTMELRLLMPGETQTARTDIPADLTAGTYRIVLRLHPEGSGASPGKGVTVLAVSAPFRVQ